MSILIPDRYLGALTKHYGGRIKSVIISSDLIKLL